MYIKRIATLVLSVCLIAAMSGCYSDTSGVNTQAYKSVEAAVSISDSKVCENNDYALYFDKTNCRISLYDKSTDTYWGTLPQEKMKVEYDEYGMPIKVHPQMESAIYVEYYQDGKKLVDRTYSYTDSVKDKSYKVEKIDNGISVVYDFADKEITVTVDYTICDFGLKVTVDPKKITEGSNKVYSIAISPFFCSLANDCDDGYLFVPSGSGAIITPTQIEDGVELTYSEEVYGRDPMVGYSLKTKTTGTESIRMPVFGVKNRDKAVCAIIADGAESASICARVGSKGIGYSAAYAQFYLRGKQLVYSNVGTTTGEGVKYSDSISDEAFSVIYSPITEGNTDYVGIAQRYREYLIKEMSLNKVEEDASAFLQFIGGVLVPDAFLGVPYDKLHVATTYKQAEDIVSDFVSQSGITPKVLLKGFSSTGIDIGKVASGFKLSSKYGKVSDIANIAKNSSNIYFDYDIVRFNASGSGYSKGSDSARGANGQISYQTFYSIWSGMQEEQYSRYVLLERGEILNAAQKLSEMKKVWDYSGVCMSSLSSIAYSDYTDGKYIVKKSMAADVAQAYSYFNQKDIDTASYQANVYAAIASDCIFATPTESSQHDIFKYDVPFYQIVLKGWRPLSTESINTTKSYDKTVLKAAESGISLSFDLSGDYDNQADSAATQVLYATDYTDVSTLVCETAKAYDTYFNKVKNAQISEHVVLSDYLRKTVFNNGITVYVNYGKTDVESPIGVIPAGEYKYIEG